MLTIFDIEKSKPRDKPYKLTDGKGLSLLIQPNGSKLWRFRYRFGGKENMLTLGAFPDVTLAGAREKRDDARKVLAEGKDPSQKRRDDKVAAVIASKNTFGIVAREHIERLKEEGAATSTVEKNEWLLLDLASALEHRPVAEITPAEILDILKKVEKSGRRDPTSRGSHSQYWASEVPRLQSLRALCD